MSECVNRPLITALWNLEIMQGIGPNEKGILKNVKGGGEKPFLPDFR
jgi:hypothetical protein